MQDKKVGIRISELVDMINDDERHENTLLALRVADGQKRINRIVQRKRFIEQLQQQEQQEQDGYYEQPPKRVMPKIKRNEYKQPTPEREKELNQKIEKSEEDELEEYGLPPEEADLLGNDYDSSQEN